MNVSDSHGLLPSVVAFAISSVLLWLGSELFAAARSRTRGAMRRLQACAILLGGFGLWWPGRFLAPLEGASAIVLGLHPVAAVGEEGGAIGCDDERCHRAVEPRGPAARLPAFRQVFREVRVARRHDHGSAADVAQQLLDAFDAKAGGRGARIHGVLPAAGQRV